MHLQRIQIILAYNLLYNYPTMKKFISHTSDLINIFLSVARNAKLDWCIYSKTMLKISIL